MAYTQNQIPPLRLKIKEGQQKDEVSEKGKGQKTAWVTEKAFPVNIL